MSKQQGYPEEYAGPSATTHYPNTKFVDEDSFFQSLKREWIKRILTGQTSGQDVLAIEMFYPPKCRQFHQWAVALDFERQYFA